MAEVRVYELAKELGIESSAVIRELQADGDFVRSASSTVRAEAVRRLRQRLASSPPQQRQVGVKPLGSAPRPMPKPQRRPLPRREWYRGEKPQGFTRVILDNYVVATRDPGVSEPRTGYFEDEVRRAKELASKWSVALFHMRDEAIPKWLGAGVSPEHAIELEAGGVHPTEVGWSYEDRGDFTLASRLALKILTPQEVITEIEGRRRRAS